MSMEAEGKRNITDNQWVEGRSEDYLRKNYAYVQE
jgi:hypothetical protein